MSTELSERLEAELRVLTPLQSTLRVPLHVLTGEAVDVARFAQRYWAAEREPGTNRVIRPGLELAGKKLDPEIIPDILVVQTATQQSQTEYLLAVTRQSPGTMDRARFVLSETTAALEWLFDDGIEDERDVQLRSLTDAHRDDPDSQDALAAELDDFVLLAEQHREALADLEAFDMALIAEGRALAQQLRERSAVEDPTERTRPLLDRRNRLAGLLQTKMTQVRGAARFVFRHYPNIIREATSAYERRRRSQARRRTRAGAGGQSTASEPSSTPQE